MTTATDIQKLETQAHELRTAMVEALGAADDSKVRKLGNELAAVNRQLIEAQGEIQADARMAYMETMHDALVVFEREGLTLTVKYAVNDEGQETRSAVYHVTGALMDQINATIANIDRPSTATKWEYGRDENGQHSFDFGKGARRVSTGGNGTHNTGWATKDGTAITLGDAFDACATAAQRAELASKDTGSQQYTLKVKVVKAAGYVKS
jgi:hypothetical protein|tara:strand:+ start:37144 stop:37770 length:627 start_codon:yes stop_codon:yes gene_type:complete